MNSPNAFPAGSTVDGVGGRAELDGGSVGAVGGPVADVGGSTGEPASGGSTGGTTGGILETGAAGTKVAGMFGGVGERVLAATGCAVGVGFAFGQCPFPFETKGCHLTYGSM